MKESDEKVLTVLSGNKTDEKSDTVQMVSRQTNPIVKRLLAFHNSQVGKFSVKDLFKK